jgi:uncharacterized protein YPO0396
VTTDLDALFALPATLRPAPPATSSAAALLVHRPTGTGPTSASGSASASPELQRQHAFPASTQWKAETFQLVNWGGFEGRHTFTFSPGATLISGASGTGKSTLLDAYIALMMPSDTPFNGASNDAVTGRARNSDQRNLISYLRGKTDTTNDDGREIDKVLRGDRTATWGAIGVTFVSDEGRRFTALRVYYLPARATRVQELTMRMATYDDALDLARLEALVGSGEQKFAPRALKEVFDGMRTYDSYATFAQALHTRLGIGANGDGEKALRLLVRIQAGHQIRTVDALYKEMVLERPTTFAAADRAIEHFDDLEAAYAAMVTEQQKVELLTPITERHETLVRARARIATLDVLGHAESHAHTPIALWRLRTQARLLATSVDSNRTNRSTTGQNLDAAQAEERRAADALIRAQEAHRDAGGATVDRIKNEIRDREELRETRSNRRAALVERTAVLDAPMDGRDDFTRLADDAAAFQAAFATTSANLRGRRDQIRDGQYPLQVDRTRLREERESLAGRQGRVPKPLDDMRKQVADAAGLDPAELPFVAELIDVAPEQARWRTAIETVLFGSARIMLVRLDILEAFSAAIDSVRLRGRLSFEGVEHAPHRDVTGDPRYIAGKLQYKDSPFSPWVADHIRARTRNALCVERPDDLAGGELRVTVAGQTRQGRRGSHGRQDAANVIGFSNEEAIADIDVALARIEADLSAISDRIAHIEREEQQFLARKDAYDAVGHYSWDDIDTESVTADIDVLTGELNRLLSGDNRLQELTDQIDELRARLADDLVPARVRLTDALTALVEEHGVLVDQQDQVSDELDRLENHGDILLSEADAEFLDGEFAAAAGPGDATDLREFDRNIARLARRLQTTADSARTEAERAERDLERIFTLYQDRWQDPNLGIGVPSYHDYARILENILGTGLHERRAEWRRRLTAWSGEDLVPLSHALDTAIEEIRDRLEPINDILRALPFGAGKDRLRIRLRHLTQDSVTGFRRELRRLASGATKDLADAETETRFRALQKFMATIRPRDDPRLPTELRESWDRDNLLDVRRHVEITAERYDLDDRLLSTHSSLGGKSGGESQELVAFIVGAALRFRLGDELRARPRFAPVFLDEGFVKSDSEFAGRAVQAWKGLGFQLIIGAPLDKVSALEGHMDELLAIAKNTETSRAHVYRLHDGATTGNNPEPNR